MFQIKETIQTVKKAETLGDKMSDNITINKNTLLLCVILGIAIIGIFMFFGKYGSAQQPAPVVTPAQVAQSGFQEISIKALNSGSYDKPEIVVKKGIPVKLSFSADSGAGCGRMLLMQNFGVQLISKNGEVQTTTFTPTQEGVFEYSCSMRMFVGRLKVVS